MPTRYDLETRAKAVRLVREHRDEYATEWAAMRAVSERLGMSAETLRKWMRQAGNPPGSADLVDDLRIAEPGGDPGRDARTIRERQHLRPTATPTRQQVVATTL